MIPLSSMILFSNYIRNVSTEDDEIMVSFDITSLHTSIPITDTLNMIKDYVNNDDQFTRKMAMPQDNLIDLSPSGFNNLLVHFSFSVLPTN